MADRLTNITRTRYGISKAASGTNLIPDWQENEPIGIAKTGAPFFDSVTLGLIDIPIATATNPEYYDDELIVGQYVNSVISVSSSAQISKTFVNGRRGGSVKQITNQGDFDITISLNIFSDYHTEELSDQGPAYTRPVGRVISRRGSTLFGNYYPDKELAKIINFFNEFYTNRTWQYVNINSLYLNNDFNITKIIPYSIHTSQNQNSTNMYSVIINAYSHFDDDPNIVTDEIIPNNDRV